MQKHVFGAIWFEAAQEGFWDFCAQLPDREYNSFGFHGKEYVTSEKVADSTTLPRLMSESTRLYEKVAESTTLFARHGLKLTSPAVLGLNGAGHKGALPVTTSR